MATIAVPGEVGPIAAEERFRICPDTGLRVHAKAETLIRVNLITAVVFLGIGGLLGLLVALTRWQAVHLLPAEMFYMVLTAHGAAVLLFWIMFFEVGLFYFTSAVVLRSRLATPMLAWLAYALMLIGALTATIAVLQGRSSVMFTSYPPLQAEPHFYLGLILFAVGMLITCFIFLGTLVIAKDERTYEGSIPLATFGGLTGVIIMIFTLASGAIILIPTLLWSVGIIAHIDPLTYKLIWWGMGHSSQQVNVTLHVVVWYTIAALVLGARPLSEKVSRSAFLLYILFLQLASAHHLLVEPGISSTWKIFNTSYAMYLAVLGSMIHGMSVPGAIEAAQRRLGYTKGIFGWLRQAPWGNPAFAGMFLSLVLFGFLGGISGVILGTEQINMLMHNTLYVPGHFHATVVAGTTLAFMAVTYLLIPIFFKRDIVFPKVAQWQPYVFAIGTAGISLFMMGAGTLGVSRRHWDITFTDALITFDYPATAFFMLGLNGLSALVATAGGAMYVIVVVGSILWGKRRTEEDAKTNPIAPGAAALASYGSEGTLKLPGTIVLVSVFFIAFALYYFINWRFLAGIWPMS
jgi:cytochrome c oxidase subunit I